VGVCAYVRKCLSVYMYLCLCGVGEIRGRGDAALLKKVRMHVCVRIIEENVRTASLALKINI
jgi:hypothetical protein